jgi:ribosome recycling factor
MPDVQSILHESEERMKKAVESLKREFGTVRTGRASTALLDNLKVEYYGSTMPINQLANMSTPDARTLEIKPWDAKALGEIEKAILKSDLGVTPNNDGKLIRICLPPPTEERRKELVKTVKKYAEDGRVVLRGIRQDANKALDAEKKESKLSEDDIKKAQENVQKLTDKYSHDIGLLTEHKEKEVLEI